MADTDKIIEAEQTIQDIAKELTRMRDAASLLETAQNHSETVMEAAERVVKTTERFSGECGTIINKLASKDLSQKLESLQKLHQEIDDAKKDLTKSLSEKIEKMQELTYSKLEKIETVGKTSGEQAHTNSEQLKNLVEERITTLYSESVKISKQLGQLEERLAKAVKGAKTRSIIIIVFVILGFLITVGSLILTLI